MMLIKICGITQADDADVAVQHGAHALGFVFWRDSPRFIEPARARTIVRMLPPFVTAVGVFVNQAIDEVNAIADQVGLGAVQLHGDETVAYAAAIDRPIVKSVAISDAVPRGDAEQWPAHVMLLIDVHDPVRRGGTGQPVDWPTAAGMAARRPVLLAGGLKPENVAAAVASVRPFGIDVSSGVERAPGVKDHARLKALFEAMSSS